jgi:hypothetical protein
MKFLHLKALPAVSWSSDKALSFRPRPLTLCFLCFGLLVFGIGEALLIAAGTGVSPWTVLAQGISNISGWSIGVSTFVISLVVLVFWIPLSQTPGLGTVLNAVIISAAIEFSLPFLPRPELFVFKFIEVLTGILMVGLGSGLYLIANLGPGPRDGLMTGLQRVSNLPVAGVRTALEITAVVIGWFLGGVVGLGTLLFALGIGPAVSLGLYLVGRFSRTRAGADLEDGG